MKIQLISTKASVGKGANDGVYPPGGLLTIASALVQSFPGLEVSIDDQHHQGIVIDPAADLVGVQVASVLCYKNALNVAAKAKEAGKRVVLGGPHVTALFRQIMTNQPSVDFCIRGKGEAPMCRLLSALQGKGVLGEVPALSWRHNGAVEHNLLQEKPWRYDDYTPLPYDCLTLNLPKYWQAFKQAIDSAVDAAFLLFTHFGCGYRQRRIEAAQHKGLPVFQTQGASSFCSYCALDDQPQSRDPHCILAEIASYLRQWQIPSGSRVHLKCYGDNIGPQKALAKSLAEAVAGCSWWEDYRITWTFYCQSSYLDHELAAALKAIGTSHLYIGFDGANDEVQKLNGLGTNMRSHRKAVELCWEYGIKIQAGSVVGLAGETPGSLSELYSFFAELRERGVLERINSAILFVIPGTPAYEMLAQKEPQIREWDLLPTTEVRALWVKHFCPKVSLGLLQEYADRIDALSPGPHASMGYESRLTKNTAK